MAGRSRRKDRLGSFMLCPHHRRGHTGRPSDDTTKNFQSLRGSTIPEVRTCARRSKDFGSLEEKAAQAGAPERRPSLPTQWLPRTVSKTISGRREQGAGCCWTPGGLRSKGLQAALTHRGGQDSLQDKIQAESPRSSEGAEKVPMGS